MKWESVAFIMRNMIRLKYAGGVFRRVDSHVEKKLMCLIFISQHVLLSRSVTFHFVHELKGRLLIGWNEWSRVSFL